jgi:hypothetical protein
VRVLDVEADGVVVVTVQSCVVLRGGEYGGSVPEVALIVGGA